MKAGVDLESSSGAAATIIDGQGARHGLVGPDVTPAQVHGITFLDCISAGTFGGTEIWGGGILAYRSQVTIEDCFFVECNAIGGGGGGGVMLAKGSGAVLRRNLFLRCVAGISAGALNSSSIAAQQSKTTRL